MAGKHGRKKPTQKKKQSDGNNSDDLSPDLCQPSEKRRKKNHGRKRKNPSSISSGVSTRTRARKAVSDGNEPVGEDVVHEESTRVREKTAVSLSLDSESEDMSAVSSKRLLRNRAKKIEVRLTSIESKENEAEENNYGEDMDFGQWDNMDCGRPEGLDKTAAEEDYDRAKGKDKDTGEEENEESTTDKKEEAEQETEQEAEEEQEKRVQDSEKEPKETPTPLRGRTKAASTRKLVHSSPEKFFQFARPSEEEELARLKERCAVQAEKLWREIEEEEEILESPDEEEVEKPQENTEKNDENPVESPAEEEVEKTQENAEELVAEPEKQWKRWKKPPKKKPRM
ncbi:unnamed protein product [Brassica napus]|uniref:(rape) hypothetical protein n=1 Tax=Brassica napus TaxID=3708 RepID=A0A816JNB2_BRANA|nr:unnamed protein product [Brassica napus]